MQKKNGVAVSNNIGLVIYDIDINTIAGLAEKASRNNLRELTSCCFHHQINQVLFSTMKTPELTYRLTKISMVNSFEAIVSDVRNRPAAIRATAAKFRMRSDRVRYIGDLPDALCEAKQVGIPTIGFANTHQAVDLVASAIPDAIAHDFEEIFYVLGLR